MKILERIIVIVFSIIILIASIFSVLLVLGWASIDFINEVIFNILNNSTVYNTILLISSICIILAIKCIFFSSNSTSKEDYRTGVLLENEDGKLIIAKDTIENLVNSVTKKFEGATEVQTKVTLDKENTITINVTLLVKENAIIKDLSANIQSQVKETIKRTSDLDVKQINIKVKNIEISKKDNIKRLESPQVEKYNKSKENYETNNISQTEKSK
ncbi:MAG TPA: alkaline shock response membrane anchor protein AmaP [Clostridia bacterium]|nr:alkaline shock response membrane anchor protein AmaP [Clostridia bacterium]